jgi:osmotically-inducible protein OsmY
MSWTSWLNWWMEPSADEVVEEAESRVRGEPYLALDDVSCVYSDGVLALCGCVATGSLKRIAEAMVARVKGVERIQNEIEVVAPAPRRLQERAACQPKRPGPRH